MLERGNNQHSVVKEVISMVLDSRVEYRNKLAKRFSFYKWTNPNGKQLFTSISIKPGWYNLDGKFH